jgi:hypothetical protein
MSNALGVVAALSMSAIRPDIRRCKRQVSIVPRDTAWCKRRTFADSYRSVLNLESALPHPVTAQRRYWTCTPAPFHAIDCAKALG